MVWYGYGPRIRYTVFLPVLAIYDIRPLFGRIYRIWPYIRYTAIHFWWHRIYDRIYDIRYTVIRPPNRILPYDSYVPWYFPYSTYRAITRYCVVHTRLQSVEYSARYGNRIFAKYRIYYLLLAVFRMWFLGASSGLLVQILFRFVCYVVKILLWWLWWYNTLITINILLWI